jgi:hypothetical protein
MLAHNRNSKELGKDDLEAMDHEDSILAEDSGEEEHIEELSPKTSKQKDKE